jgi:two-component system, chemotaxis family, chemotaxis protein CheY
MRKMLLIVDDNTFVRRALREIFEREGDFKICGEADNGRDAIEAVMRLQPDLVVLDFSMPIMNGIEAARILKDRAPTVPLILYSAVADEAVAQLARSVGITDLVSKSEPVSVLISRVRGVLRQVAA